MPKSPNKAHVSPAPRVESLQDRYSPTDNFSNPDVLLMRKFRKEAPARSPRRIATARLQNREPSFRVLSSSKLVYMMVIAALTLMLIRCNMSTRQGTPDLAKDEIIALATAAAATAAANEIARTRDSHKVAAGSTQKPSAALRSAAPVPPRVNPRKAPARRVQRVSQKLQTKRPTASKSAPAGAKPRAVVVWLTTARAKDLNDLKQSLDYFCTNFNDRYNYPAVIFHEGDLTATHQSELRAHAKKTPLTFATVQLGPPDEVDLSKMHSVFAHWKARYKPGTKTEFGYSNMIRFWVQNVFHHPIMQKFDYYMRLDTDSRIATPVKYDMFRAMDAGRYKYGFVSLVTDNKHYTEGLWALTLKHASDHSVKPAWPRAWGVSQDGHRRGAMFSFYNNFEIVNIPWFRQSQVQAYTDSVDKAGGIYSTRWGDATIRFLQLAMFGGPDVIRGFCDAFSYRHDGRTITQGSCHVRSRGKCGCNGMLTEVAHPLSDAQKFA